MYNYDFSKINKIKKSKKKKLKIFYDRRFFKYLREDFFTKEYAKYFLRQLNAGYTFQICNSMSSVKKKNSY